jgi:hypothetical protein
MVLRRASITAPLAVLVAIGGHWAGFGAEHALGGLSAGGFVAVGLGGGILLALAALGWAAIACRDARSGERRLLALLPGRGVLGNSGVLAFSGFLAFAAGEALEGRSPFGTGATALGIIVSAVLIALVARRVVRWLAAGGVTLAAILAPERRGSGGLPYFLGASSRFAIARSVARAACRGRAPPLFA